ncbi:MAG: kelch repeat-containing protein, partial [Planctomycetota bacterium]
MIRTLVLALLPCALPAQAAWRALPELNERTGHAMAYDPIRKRVVLFGGFFGPLTPVKVAGRVYFDDTWEWDGKTWQPRRPLHSPSPRNGHGMAYD